MYVPDFCTCIVNTWSLRRDRLLTLTHLHLSFTIVAAHGTTGSASAGAFPLPSKLSKTTEYIPDTFKGTFESRRIWYARIEYHSLYSRL